MLILASSSPRRKQLLSLITEDFLVDVSDADETLPEGISPAEAVCLLAERKARAVADRRAPCDTVVGSDTVVVLDGAILGKPANRADAARMLSALSGRTHHVDTGVCVLHGGEKRIFLSGADVTFAPMTAPEIDAYLDTGEPFDKAGAYGVQGMGARFIERIDGDFYAVMGLPVQKLYAALRDLSSAQ